MRKTLALLLEPEARLGTAYDYIRSQKAAGAILARDALARDVGIQVAKSGIAYCTLKLAEQRTMATETKACPPEGVDAAAPPRPEPRSPPSAAVTSPPAFASPVPDAFPSPPELISSLSDANAVPPMGGASVAWFSRNREASEARRKDLEAATGKSFGGLVAVDRHADTGAVALVHERGFAAFLPETLYDKFDVSLNPFLVCVERACWLTRSTDAFIKTDVDAKVLAKDPLYADYVAADPATRLRAALQFIDLNFATNPRAYPDSNYFTIGFRKRNPSADVPMRIRMGGDWTPRFVRGN